MSLAQLPAGLDQPTDEELLHRGRAGDRAALELLVERHTGTVTAVCRSRLRPNEVADAAQETFLRALSSLHQLRDADRFGAWIRAIASRVCADVHRSRGRRHLVPLDDDGLLPGAAVPDDDPDPAEQLERHEEARRLHLRLGGLSERDRRALWLRDAMGVPVPDVAAELGVTEGSARVLLTRARHRLRSAYGSLVAFLVPVSRPWRRPQTIESATLWGPSAHAALLAAAVVGGTVAGVGTAPVVTATSTTPVVAAVAGTDVPSAHDATLAAAEDVRAVAAAGEVAPPTRPTDEDAGALLRVGGAPDDRDPDAHAGARVGEDGAGASVYGVDPKNLEEGVGELVRGVGDHLPVTPPLP